MTRLLDEIADQVAFTWGRTMDADELRLVWTHMRGTAMTIDRRLTVEQTLNINRPSWCREQDHGPDVNPAIFTDFSQPYILRMVSDRPAFRLISICLLFMRRFAFHERVFIFDIPSFKLQPGSIPLFLCPYVLTAHQFPCPC